MGQLYIFFLLLQKVSREHIIRVSNVYIFIPTQLKCCWDDECPVKKAKKQKKKTQKKRCFVNSVPLFRWYGGSTGGARPPLPRAPGTILFISQLLPRSSSFVLFPTWAGAFRSMGWLALSNVPHLSKNILINLPAEPSGHKSCTRQALFYSNGFRSEWWIWFGWMVPQYRHTTFLTRSGHVSAFK